MRKKAMERLSETKRRKAKENASSDEEPKKKIRSSGGEIVAYLKEKNEKELEMRKCELEMKKKSNSRHIRKDMMKSSIC